MSVAAADDREVGTAAFRRAGRALCLWLQQTTVRWGRPPSEGLAVPCVCGCSRRPLGGDGRLVRGWPCLVSVAAADDREVGTAAFGGGGGRGAGTNS